MKFEFYVLNYDCNKKCVESFNVFRNINVQERTEKEIKKYLRSPKKYKHMDYHTQKCIYGFDALCEEIRTIIMWQEWSRREYEISVSDAFVTEISDVLKDIDKFDSIEAFKKHLETINKRNPELEKWDCYMQCEPNIKAIAYEIIRQYKEQKTNE